MRSHLNHDDSDGPLFAALLPFYWIRLSNRPYFLIIAAVFCRGQMFGSWVVGTDEATIRVISCIDSYVLKSCRMPPSSIFLAMRRSLPSRMKKEVLRR